MGPMKGKQQAFTIIELLVCCGVIGILASMMLSALSKAQPKAKQLVCVSNLHQTGIAFHVFANDHNNRLPPNVSVDDGGANEYLVPGFYVGGLYPVFASISNELVNPKVLVCPSDNARTPAQNFGCFGPQNLSYFAGLEPSMAYPNSLLGGDRNFVITQTLMRWNTEMHVNRGDLLFADAHVDRTVQWDIRFADGIGTNGAGSWPLQY